MRGYSNLIYTSLADASPTICLSEWAPENEIMMRICWAKHFIKTDRMPEAFVQLLNGLKHLDSHIHSHIEHLELCTLLISVSSQLHVNIRATTFLIVKFLSLINVDCEKCIFVPAIITFFGELGCAEWAKQIYSKFIDPNPNSLYHKTAVYNFSNVLIEAT